MCATCREGHEGVRLDKLSPLVQEVIGVEVMRGLPLAFLMKC